MIDPPLRRAALKGATRMRQSRTPLPAPPCAIVAFGDANIPCEGRDKEVAMMRRVHALRSIQHLASRQGAHTEHVTEPPRVLSRTSFNRTR